MAQRLQYALALLLYTVIVLSLYELVGQSFIADTPDRVGWVAVLGASMQSWLVGLAPAAILMVVMGGVTSGRRPTRIIWLGMAVVFSTATGVILQDLLFAGGDVPWLLANPRDVLADMIGIGLPAGLLTAVYEFHLRSVDATEAAFRVQADRIAMEAEMSKARVRLLRAQIEPHFIFNSLAHVRRLFQVDAATGHKMLSSLIRYFGSALPSLRQETCSLAEEAALIDAYLDIHRLRMGSRLAYEVAFPASLLELQVPSMLLLTLVENAIKHGVSPLLEGGFVRISAYVSGNVLELRVADSGCGMIASSGSGTGLANIRARLGSLYGAAGSLTLSNNEPRGITAAVRVPLQSATP
jgi:Histidine kinase